MSLDLSESLLDQGAPDADDVALRIASSYHWNDDYLVDPRDVRGGSTSPN